MPVHRPALDFAVHHKDFSEAGLVGTMPSSISALSKLTQLYGPSAAMHRLRRMAFVVIAWHLASAVVRSAVHVRARVPFCVNASARLRAHSHAVLACMEGPNGWLR